MSNDTARSRPNVSENHPERIRPPAFPMAVMTKIATGAMIPALLANGDNWLIVICPAVVPRQYATHNA